MGDGGGGEGDGGGGDGDGGGGDGEGGGGEGDGGGGEGDGGGGLGDGGDGPVQRKFCVGWLQPIFATYVLFSPQTNTHTTGDPPLDS